MVFKPWRIAMACPKCARGLEFEVCDEPDESVGIFGYATLLIGHADGSTEHGFTLDEVDALERAASDLVWQREAERYGEGAWE